MTNSNLVTVFNGTIQNTHIQLCNARELHHFLEVGKDYSNWIKNRITDYGFVQDEDYIIVTQRTNGRPRKEYHITLDMGKELAMVERNEKGRQVRKYFIECERRALQQPKQLALPEPEKKYTFEFTEYELEQLAWLWFSHKRMNTLLADLYEPLNALGSTFSGSVYSHAHEYHRHHQESQATMQRLIEPFKQSTKLNWQRVIPKITPTRNYLDF
ncbi:antA/AntB antirepressor family protein [Avibacterium paragallinarum]|uniref:antA/AntB antirepressor family protein n=1 Tax=Avibacterium paragallinarum TaxID=728 RepID=UPI0021F78AC9|nr:antA/AntB antirepressor family protein [Avibacterium paragallinarum]UXN37528.1 antA/AntB antirepressor family protein [Avibacterium paragallinarum]